MSRDIMRELIVHLAERGQIDDEKAQEWLGLIDRNSEVMAGMMSQLDQLGDEPPSIAAPVPRARQVWRNPKGRKVVLSRQVAEGLRRDGADDWEYVCEKAHSEEPHPDFSYTCFSQYCRCLQ